MADKLVKELNRRGYQPLFLPRTGVTPPDLFNWARTRRRLVRRAHLSKYLPAGTPLDVSWARSPDIEQHEMSSKNQSAGLSFLKNALACIGIDGTPTLDLSFIGEVDLTFRFTDLSVATFEDMDRIIGEKLALDAIPPEYFEAGDLHVAYEYLYARELLLSRSDQRAFEHDVSGKLGSYVDVGLKGKVKMQSDTTISFSGQSTENVAFACKFGQLVRRDRTWFFYPEEGKMGDDDGRRPVIPARGVVLGAEPGD